MIEDLGLDELERIVLSLYCAPRAVFGVPHPRSYTTPYADLLDAIGEHEAAAKEREVVCRDARRRMGIADDYRGDMICI